MKNTKRIILLAFMVLLFIGCNKKEKEVKEKDSHDIIGKWKLEQVTYPDLLDVSFKPISYDYSQYGIVYEFKKNGVLTVSGVIDHIDTYAGHKICKHSYSFIEDEKGYGQPGLPYGLKIDDDFPYWYRISSEELEITAAPIDGEIYYFVKIK